MDTEVYRALVEHPVKFLLFVAAMAAVAYVWSVWAELRPMTSLMVVAGAIILPFLMMLEVVQLLLGGLLYGVVILILMSVSVDVFKDARLKRQRRRRVVYED